MLDAPVSGGEIGAINAALSIMVGGDEATFHRMKPILDVMGNKERVVYIGRSGAGQICKICNQVAIGGALAGVSEAFALAKKTGVDAARVRQALLGGFTASACWWTTTSRASARSCIRRTCGWQTKRPPPTASRCPPTPSLRNS